MIARMIYQDGVNALTILGGAFAAGMFGWSITESGLFGILINIAAILGCLIASLLDERLGSKPVVAASILCLTVATIAIVSTAPGFTLFGLIDFGAPATAPMPAGGGLFSTPGRKGLHPLRPLDRPRLRPGPGLVALLARPDGEPRGGRPLFRLLCADRPGDVLPGHGDGRRPHRDRRPAAPTRRRQRGSAWRGSSPSSSSAWRSSGARPARDATRD